MNKAEIIAPSKVSAVARDCFHDSLKSISLKALPVLLVKYGPKAAIPAPNMRECNAMMQTRVQNIALGEEKRGYGGKGKNKVGEEDEGSIKRKSWR